MTQAPTGVDPQDWVTIWQSEWAAIALDRELQEGLATAALAWNLAAAGGGGGDGSAGGAGADAQAGSAPAGHAFGARQPEPSGA